MSRISTFLTLEPIGVSIKNDIVAEGNVHLLSKSKNVCYPKHLKDAINTLKFEI